MRKLHHKNSCHVTAVETSSTLPEELPTQLNQSNVRALEGKILLLQERGKNIQQFYENKMAQLRTVLAKQGETRAELTQELRRLTAEGQKQQKYVGQLKSRLQEERTDCRLTDTLRLRPQGPSGEKWDSKRSSRGKACLLFNSKDLTRRPAGLLALKKCRSEQYLESEYFGEALGRSQKSMGGNAQRGQ